MYDLTYVCMMCSHLQLWCVTIGSALATESPDSDALFQWSANMPASMANRHRRLRCRDWLILTKHADCCFVLIGLHGFPQSFAAKNRSCLPNEVRPSAMTGRPLFPPIGGFIFFAITWLADTVYKNIYIHPCVRHSHMLLLSLGYCIVLCVLWCYLHNAHIIL